MFRRTFLQSSGRGFSSLSLSALTAGTELKTETPKRVIFLCMKGAPSHVDTFDYKPALTAHSGRSGQRPGTKLRGSPWKFRQHGKSGLWISELFPHLSACADELCMLHGMQAEIPAHPQACLQMHTGSSQFVRPSMGAWILHGAGTLNRNLPGFVTITPSSGFGGAQNYGSSFLPTSCQGTRIGTESRRMSEVQPANMEPQLPAASQRRELDFLQTLNRLGKAQRSRSPGITGLTESFDLAYRMQNEMPDVMNTDQESRSLQTLYGIGEPETDDFGRKCLLARRMAEAGVRFIEVSHGDWDHHANLQNALPQSCREVDKPLRGLLTDLRNRGMLHDTLVIWGGEFGRTPHAEGDGRDHNVKAFTMWMAGAGVRGGFAYGASDDYGYEAVDGIVSIADWHATILHAVGLDPNKLAYPHAGRNFQLSDGKGRVIREIFSSAS